MLFVFFPLSHPHPLSSSDGSMIYFFFFFIVFIDVILLHESVTALFVPVVFAIDVVDNVEVEVTFHEKV